MDVAEAARRAVRVMSKGVATNIEGGDLPMRAETVCVHSDTPGADRLAQAVNEALRPWFA